MPDEDPDIVRLQERFKALDDKVSEMGKRQDGLTSKLWWIVTVGVGWALTQVLNLITSKGH